MDEAKRRKASEVEITRIALPGNDTKALVGSVMQNIADILVCVIFIKETGDELLDWTPGSIIGKAAQLVTVKV